MAEHAPIPTWLAPYLPTPKMARVLWGGLLTVALIFGLRFAGVDISDEVTAIAPVIVAGVWGWAKREPAPDERDDR